MSETLELDPIKKIFGAFLEKNKQRKTPERFAILEEVYCRDDHFDAETLFNQMKEADHNISRATVYNTLDILVACDLVTRHQFGKNIAQYEKSFGYKQHDHLICLDCKKVVEFCDPRIHEINSKVGELLKFKITHHSLNLYGNCEDANCENRKITKKRTNGVSAER